MPTRPQIRRRSAGQHREAAPRNEQLPALIGRTEILGEARTRVVPAFIAGAGERASLRLLEFFAANIQATA
jgi:hypothetical protein